MAKVLTMLAGGALGVAAAVAVGAPSPQTLLAHLTDGTAAVPVANQTTACATHWGTGPEQSSRPVGPSTARVASVHTGQHACYDRLVIDLGRGTKPGYQVRYVHKLHAQGSGQAIAVRGHAVLEITVADNARARYPASARELANVSGYRSFRQVAGAGSFEGSTELGIGTRAKLPFRVHLIKGPGQDSRLVIDVAHHR
ncbi:MAG: hypothetical protein ABJB47_09330 [Actinomycetota bacterium]